MTKWRSAGLLGAVVLALSVPPGAGPDAEASYSGANSDDKVVFTIRAPEITESSSLAISTVDPGLTYTTNDSGDGGTVYVLDSKTGALVGRTTLAGADPLDVEAIAVGTDGSLVVADIGDNNADHSTADLYRIDQPGRGEHAVTPDRVDLTYPGGARDAESVVYDTSTGRAYIVSKLFGGARVYVTPPHVFRFDNARLRVVAKAPPLATDAALLPDGRHAVIRTYFDASVYTFPEWKEIAIFNLPPQEQGESIAVPPSGDVVWVGSEGVRSRVTAVPLPDLTAAPQGGSGTAAPSGAAGDQVADGSAASDAHDSARELATVVFLGGLVGLAALLLVVLFLALHRRLTPPR
ncbi:MAG: hypothetical protein WAK18_08335 [Nocardioidaceae bacterium]